MQQLGVLSFNGGCSKAYFQRVLKNILNIFLKNLFCALQIIYCTRQIFIQKPYYLLVLYAVTISTTTNAWMDHLGLSSYQVCINISYKKTLQSDCQNCLQLIPVRQQTGKSVYVKRAFDLSVQTYLRGIRLKFNNHMREYT